MKSPSKKINKGLRPLKHNKINHALFKFFDFIIIDEFDCIFNNINELIEIEDFGFKSFNIEIDHASIFIRVSLRFIPDKLLFPRTITVPYYWEKGLKTRRNYKKLTV